MISGRFVAATIITPTSGSTPSSSVRSWVRTRSPTVDSEPARLTARASISS